MILKVRWEAPLGLILKIDWGICYLKGEAKRAKRNRRQENQWRLMLAKHYAINNNSSQDFSLKIFQRSSFSN